VSKSAEAHEIGFTKDTVAAKVKVMKRGAARSSRILGLGHVSASLDVLMCVTAISLVAPQPTAWALQRSPAIASTVSAAPAKTRVRGSTLWAGDRVRGEMLAEPRGHWGRELVAGKDASGFPLAAEGGAASSARNGLLLRNQLMAEEIAGGHAFAKHVIQQAEFPGITLRSQFASEIENFLNSPGTIMRDLSGGRSAFWNNTTGTVLIRNPAALDGGTYFRPIEGINYFWGLK
jgi:hypothetical protein